jgi:gliding motility-associated-like protein
LSSFSIFNRYGQLVFKTKAEDGYWDGTFNGKLAAAGTYYWVFETLNLYDHQKHSHAGYITLIR